MVEMRLRKTAEDIVAKVPKRFGRLRVNQRGDSFKAA
jgi:hypothetical protein